MDTPWMEVARYFLNAGVHRVPGARDDPAIVQMFDICGFRNLHDETAWCAAFIGACLRLAGYDHDNSLHAHDYANFGRSVSSQDPEIGCIVVFKQTATHGHVAFLLTKPVGGEITVLGGNQGVGHAVTFSKRSVADVVFYRWPTRQLAAIPDMSRYPNLRSIDQLSPGGHVRGGPANDQSGPISFEDASFGHVANHNFAGHDNFGLAVPVILAYEGGSKYTNNPKDRGGPTKYGITLGALQGFRKTPQTAADVQNLSQDEATRIYRKDYWDAVNGDALPLPLAFLAFNAAVLCGVQHGIRFLQKALQMQFPNLAASNHVGQAISFAAEQADQGRAIEDFCAIQTAFHQQHGNAAFIRGWLARVKEAKKQALEWAQPNAGTGNAGTGNAGSAVMQFDTDYTSLGKTDIESLQTALKKLGYPLGKIDGIFGSFTAGALASFLHDNDMPPGSSIDAVRSALANASQRPIFADRAAATSDDLLKAGSVVVQSGNRTNLLGILASVFGSLGVLNSAALQFPSQQTTSGSSDALAKTQIVLQKIIEDLGPVAKAAPKSSSVPTEFQDILNLATSLKAQLPKSQLTSDPAQLLEVMKTLIGALPADTKGFDQKVPLIDFITQAQSSLASTKPAINHTIFDILPSLFASGGNLQATASGIASVASSMLPGFGGSMATLAIGLIASYLGKQTVDARVADHRSGNNIKF